MEIVKTIKVKMSQKEKEAFDTVMESFGAFCTKMGPLDRNDEEDFIFYTALNALDYLEDFKTLI